ncbi:hypothetical protein [Amycolatopsis pittospori]|uniref:hypothetical protein n=1 Tax=Amycolatopsis pittospori TaxID=2749434 RepID=UPI0015F000B5|nr:hypothetical protein [Amycolatopsis pittospori]
MKRWVAAALTTLALFGTAACDGEEASSPPPDPASAPGDLSDIQRTLDSIEQEMAGDPAP